MILNIAQIIFGLAFFLFIPGFIIVQLFFKESKTLEQILLAILFSIMVGLAIGVFFGYDRAQAVRTGGFTANNLWTAQLIITTLLLIILIIKRRLTKPVKRKKWQRSKKTSKN